jgi:hypothetical protein
VHHALDDLAAAYGRLAVELRAATQRWPGAAVVRSRVGSNLAVVAGGVYVAWVDVLEGRLHVIEDEP